MKPAQEPDLFGYVARDYNGWDRDFIHSMDKLVEQVRIAGETLRRLHGPKVLPFWVYRKNPAKPFGGELIQIKPEDMRPDDDPWIKCGPR